MKKIFLILFPVIVFSAFTVHKYISDNAKQSTICNPLNLSYRFCLDDPSRREAADPVIVLYKNTYYLFASKSGGYWSSKDLISWDFITSPDLPLEDYAPGVEVINDTLYYMASAAKPVKIYKTADPLSGKWKIANAVFPIGMTDPDLFADDNGRVYFYYGCSNVDPIYGVELDPKTLNPIGKPVECFNSNTKKYGWERRGDFNELGENPWIEGAWMTKYKGRYYLQYAAPGTEYKSYSDAVYISENPLGPFKLAAHNPCAYKPGGFITGAGHSNMFKDKYGNYWRVSTMTISMKHVFERRLGLFPVFFDKDSIMYTYTRFGDFPFRIPDKKISGPEELFPGWMLLSYNKKSNVSSESDKHPKAYATDEEVRTYWSAKTGNKGEWLSIDLEKECVINALQINFAENEAKLYGRNPDKFHQYLIEYSSDNKIWKSLLDKTQNKSDVPHDYMELPKAVSARYIKLTNYQVPGGTFALSDFRIFGNGKGNPPSMIKDFKVLRSKDDPCIVKLKWKGNPAATGYNIRYGISPDKLYQNYQVMRYDSVTIRSLNSSQKYYFSIEGFNDNGTSARGEMVEVK